MPLNTNSVGDRESPIDSIISASLGAALLGGLFDSPAPTDLKYANSMLRRSNERLREKLKALEESANQTSDSLGLKIDSLRNDREALQARVDALVQGADLADDIIANLSSAGTVAMDYIGDIIAEDVIGSEQEAEIFFDLRGVIKQADEYLEGVALGAAEADMASKQYVFDIESDAFDPYSGSCGPGCTCYPQNASGAAGPKGSVNDPIAAFGGVQED